MARGHAPAAVPGGGRGPGWSRLVAGAHPRRDRVGCRLAAPAERDPRNDVPDHAARLIRVSTGGSPSPDPIGMTGRVNGFHLHVMTELQHGGTSRSSRENRVPGRRGLRAGGPRRASGFRPGGHADGARPPVSRRRRDDAPHGRLAPGRARRRPSRPPAAARRLVARGRPRAHGPAGRGRREGRHGRRERRLPSRRAGARDPPRARGRSRRRRLPAPARENAPHRPGADRRPWHLRRRQPRGPPPGAAGSTPAAACGRS